MTRVAKAKPRRTSRATDPIGTGSCRADGFRTWTGSALSAARVPRQDVLMVTPIPGQGLEGAGRPAPPRSPPRWSPLNSLALGGPTLIAFTAREAVRAHAAGLGYPPDATRMGTRRCGLAELVLGFTSSTRTERAIRGDSYAGWLAMLRRALRKINGNLHGDSRSLGAFQSASRRR